MWQLHQCSSFKHSNSFTKLVKRVHKIPNLDFLFYFFVNIGTKSPDDLQLHPPALESFLPAEMRLNAVKNGNKPFKIVKND